MIQLFQIGNVPLHLHQKWHRYEAAVDSKDIRLAQSSRTLYANSQYQLKPRTINIEGTLQGNCDLTPDNQFLMLSHLVGLPTDIIGFVRVGCCGGIGCPCQVKGRCEVLWLHNRGKLTSISTDPRNGLPSVKLSIVIDTLWKPVDRGIWEYTARPSAPYAITSMPMPSQFSTDLIQAATLTASSTNGGNVANNVKSSSLTTYWEANAASPGWLQGFFPETKPVRRVVLSSGSAANTGAPQAFEIEYYDDDSLTWVSVYSAAGLTWALGETKDFHFPNSISATLWRIRVTATAGGNPRIAQFKLYEYDSTFWKNEVMKPLPTCNMVYAKSQCFMWVKRFYLYDNYHYEPDYLQAWFTGNREGYPPVGVVVPWSGTEQVYTLPTDDSYWNAIPLSVYQLRGLANVSEANIYVTRVTDVWQPRADTTTLDVTELKARILAAGYPALTNDDRVILGQVFNAPGIILRANDTFITDVVMPVEYDSAFPGLISPGFNQVQIVMDDDQAESMQAHIFRRL